MATQQLDQYNTVTVPAGADLSAKQFHFVKLNSSGQVVSCGLGEQAYGVLLNKPDAAGKAASVQIGGIAKVVADASVTAADKVMSSADGQAATKTGTYNELGQANITASGGEYVEVTLGASDGIAGGGVATVTSGAVDPGVSLTLLSVTGTVAYTLADGTILGQEITIECSVAATSPAGTLTINDAYGSEPTSYIFNAVGQRIKLRWTSTGWKLQELRPAGNESLAAAATANPLVLLHLVNLDSTNDYIQGSGLVPGQESIWIATAGTGSSTISGLFYDEDGSADGIDIGLNAAADQATLVWAGARWIARAQVSAAISP